MSNDNKTLADVQPGGRVRLGDAPWPEIDAILADAYSAGAEGLPFEGIARRAAVRKAVAALSAQPSPGGQEDAVHCGKCKGRGYVHVDVDVDDSGGSIGNIEACPHCAIAAPPSPGGQGDNRSEKAETFLRQYLTYLRSSPRQGLRPRWCDVYEALEVAIEVLAARQPVYEGHTWISDYILADLRQRAAFPLQLRNGEVWHWQGDGHDFPESLVCPVIMSAETLRALLAARQPVGEPVDDDDAASEAFAEFADDYLTDGNGYAPASTYEACGNAFKAAWPDRDAAVRAARAELKRLHGDDRTVGARRAEALNRADARDDAEDDAAPPAQAVDLGQIIEQIAQQWDGCSYEAVGETIDVGQAIRAAGKRLINGKAVGNG